ncbi:sensor histidine kinase [Bacillus sp. AK128]
MTLVFKQVLYGLSISTICAILLLTGTFIAFPFWNWTELWNANVYGIPYWMVISTITIAIGLISGFSMGLYWNDKLLKIKGNLEEIIRGQKVSRSNSETAYEVVSIHEQLVKLEDKFIKQAELSQRLATERANEREKSLQEVVVQERNRLARELHDSVSQQLFAASMMMSAINETNIELRGPISKQLLMVENMIHQSQMEMRALLLHLRPVALKGKTLKEGIEELLSELTQKVPMDIVAKVESIELDKGVEDQLFRILQESVSNALRHAKANSIQVMLINRDDNVILRIADDGIGFKVEEEKTSSYGLQNMQERALEVGGSLKIISLENQGTRLEVKVPYIKKGVGNND